MDMMDNYKLEALDSMKKTVEVLSTEVEKAQSYMDRSRGETVSRATANLGINPSDEIIL